MSRAADDEFLRPAGWGWFPLRGERARIRTLNEKYERILAGVGAAAGDDATQELVGTPTTASPGSWESVGEARGESSDSASPEAEEMEHELALAAALDRSRPSVSPNAQSSERMRRRLFEAMAEEGFGADVRTDPAVVEAVVHVADELAVRRAQGGGDDKTSVAPSSRDEDLA